jgi:probable F420-dependent oxidoreductase
MKFAMHIPIGDITPGQFQSAAAIAEMIRALEAAKVGACFVTDHPAPSAEWLHADGHDALDPFTALAFVAASSSRLQFFTNILVLPYRNPFLTAKAAASLQVLSGGRFILGVSGGYQKAEFDALGVDFRKRGALTDEAIEVIRLAWTGEIVVRQGSTFNATGNQLRPAPNPPPPIWVGGSSDNAVRRAARSGDGWCPFFARPGQTRSNQEIALQTPQQLADKIAAIKALRIEHGRSGPFDIAIGPPQRPAIGSPGDVERYLEALHHFEAIGVTWATVVPPRTSRRAYLDYVQWFGGEVIARC